MKNVGKLVLAFLFSLFVAIAVAPTRGFAAEGLLTGELVAIKGSAHQFRLVGHGGTFSAPAGVSVAELDGKPVQVEVRGGRVVDISVMPVPIQPVEHGEEVVTGQLVVRDAVTGSFAFAGDDRVYVAPPGLDIRPYEGRMVELHFDEHGKLISLTPRSQSAIAPTSAACMYAGQPYSDGASSCQSGYQYRCEFGAWRNLGLSCPASPPIANCSLNGVNYLEGAVRCAAGTQFSCERGQWRNLGSHCGESASIARTCLIGDATVAHGSSICREGTTFKCTYGQWVNLGSACS